MAQILRILSYKRIMTITQFQTKLFTRDLISCHTCQRLQQCMTSRLFKPGFNILYRRSSSMKIAEKVPEPIQRHADQKLTELRRLLEARITQLNDPCTNTSKLKVEPQRPHTQGKPEDSWACNLKSFKDQMSKHLQTNNTLPKAKNIKLNAPVEFVPKKNPRKQTKSGQSTKTAQMTIATPGSNAIAVNPNDKTAVKPQKAKSKATKTVVPKLKHNRKVTEASVVAAEPLQAEAVIELSALEGNDEIVDSALEDFHAINGDHDIDVIKEMRGVLEEKQTARKVVRRMEKHMQRILKLDLAPESLTRPFWKPELLKNMSEVKGGLEVIQKLTEKMTQLQLVAVKREMEQLAKHRNVAYNNEMRAYVDACLHAGLLRKAHGMIVAKEVNKRSLYRTKMDSPEFAITDVDVYNKVMSAWAKQGDLVRIKRLFQQMVSTGVKPSLQSYAALLECLGRTDPISTEAVQQCLDDIRTAELGIEKMQEECYFEKDEWDCVNEAILSVQSDFTCGTRRPTQQYACHLLSDLNVENEARVPNLHAGLMSPGELKHLAGQQMAHERTDFVTVGTILPANDHIPKVLQARKCLEETKTCWQDCLRLAFKRDLMIEEKHKQNVTGLSIVPYLKLFPHNTYINLMMQEVDTIALETENYSPSVSMLQRQFGMRVNRHFMVKDRVKSGYLNKLSKAYKDYLEDYLKEERPHITDRQCWQSLLDQHTGNVQIDTCPKVWPAATTRMIGRWLYRLILMDIKIDANIFKETSERKEIPAFYTVYRQEGLLVKEVIKPHPLLVRLYRTANVQTLTFDTVAMPSLTPPLPWTSVTSGGNLLSTTNLMINAQRSGEQMSKLQAFPKTQLNAVFDALNVLGATPWRINTPILDFIADIFNSGGNPSLEIPRPASSFPDPPKIAPWMSDEEKVTVLRERVQMKKEQQEMHSLWMTELYRLSIANHYRNNVFWFPHNMDFRSRVYATPPHFNHLGSDLARSILIFAEGKKLGPHGLDWLKIHLINLTGFKKRSSNADRLEYANELFHEITDSATNPMDGRGWWKTSDEPWQTLACCMEIVKAAKFPHPEEYVCRYPVHQDGSCNGLQHYAALGRDQAGAKSVNLYPSSIPKDVYSDVVELVEKERQKDAAAGENIAKTLEGFIQRKVIKQTIMTTVYGVTRFGARLQIEGQLQDIEDFPAKRSFEASLYLTRKTFDCLQMMFTSTKEIQEWLTVCAKLASSIHYKPVEWQTPLGWPVIQPYYRQFNPATLLKLPKAPHIEITNKNRQKNGFPPNFIHSLDSTHMMLTAVRCQRAGVTFVSVHDCFWTHPADVAKMNRICREEFVALHNEPILENLAASLYDKYGCKPGESDLVDPITQDFINHVLQRVPERGSFDLSRVLDSTYFFS